ncbi:serine/threonine-protein kinase Nek2-like [Homarus americanus]|uniref:non-specific serine/threonine protein kinase n=1 Tax=Homarus americanus TaxID=6706 RepID=A0A8J5MS10_HOMAM|nr:serine/threonine-protein kinase Nek2-like [Homarus americanus]
MGPKLDEFEVQSTIGSGAHGTVRKVRRQQDGQILVWKELNYGAMSEVEKQGLVLEVNLLRELHHPNIVKFLHHIVERRSTTLYILMEYCPGGDLKHLISKCRQTSTFLEEGFIWRVLKQLRGGRIILHRDIKPANVFLDAEGEVKLGDFGLARTLNSEASFATTFVGTPYYMSPEVIEGQEYNEKSDMWSLGCLVYELCALHPPFQATTHKQLAAKIREARYERIPIQYSSALQEVLGLLLTYEDFLRPTALMVLHHSAVVAHTSSKNQLDDDPLFHSLSHSVLLGAGKNTSKKSEVTEDPEVKRNSDSKESRKMEVEKDGNCEKVTEISGETISTKENNCSNNSRKLQTVEIYNKDEPQINNFRDQTISPMTETYSVTKAEISCKCDSREKQRSSVHQNKLVSNQSEVHVSVNNLPHENNVQLLKRKEHTEAGLEDTIEKICRAAKETGHLPHRGSKTLEGTCDLNLAKLECACGGMSTKVWRERFLALREAELAVREREVALREKERDVSHREHRVAAMEKEARQHLVRAQIYLRQSRPRQNAATSPHRPPSDMDTTMSADPGDDDVTTTTKLDPQRISNPFLKMRGIQPQPEKRVSFKEKPIKFKSNTLDNPKSRRKRGNIFRLAEPKKENTDKVHDEIICKIPLQTLSSNDISTHQQGQKLTLPSDQKSQDSPLPPASHLNPQKTISETTNSQKSLITGNLQERPRSTESLNKKSLEAGSDKENVGRGTKPKKVPEIKPGFWSRRPGSRVVERTGRRERDTTRSQNPVVRFYNMV